MTLIRKITGTNQKMSINDAMVALSNMRSFTINLDRGADFGLSQLDKSGLFYLAPNGKGATQVKNNVPFDGKWWYVLSFYTDHSNSFQIAIPDSADVIYMRSKTGSAWNQWNKIGGGLNNLTPTVLPLHRLEVAA